MHLPFVVDRGASLVFGVESGRGLMAKGAVRGWIKGG